MIFLRDEPPPLPALEQLGAWQAEVDAIPDYPARVEHADRRFNARNRKGNQTFEAVRGALRSMTGEIERCCYCEDSLAHQIEHVRPRSLSPEQVFVWPNMLWACGFCNNRKLARHAVVLEDQLVEVVRRRGEPVEPPLAGAIAMLDPRAEDPMAFMSLDLADTFQFVARLGLDIVAAKRVRYTIDVLGLNDDPFPALRNEAYFQIQESLSEYVRRRDLGDSEMRLANLRARFARRSHQTVWREVQRQMRARVRPLTLGRDFSPLFDVVPEALTW